MLVDRQSHLKQICAAAFFLFLLFGENRRTKKKSVVLPVHQTLRCAEITEMRSFPMFFCNVDKLGKTHDFV